jgi:hypothetical protein
MLHALCHAQFAKPATLHVFALFWLAKTGSIAIFDLLGVNVRGNAFSTDAATEIFRGLIHDPDPIALHTDISHFSIPLGQRSVGMKRSYSTFIHIACSKTHAKVGGE